MPAKDQAPGYGLDTSFEWVIGQFALTSPAFWGRIGHAVDPDRLATPGVRLAYEACRAIAAEGHVPTNSVVVLQRLARWHDEGRTTTAQIRDVRKLARHARSDVEDFNLEMVIGDLAPVIKRQATKSVLEKCFDRFAKRGDLTDIGPMLGRIGRIGLADTVGGTRVTAGAIDLLRKLSLIQRLPTGIEDLDAELRGGFRRGTYSVITGPSGSGKSMAIDHFIAHAMTQHFVCAIATLELSEEDHLARIIGNLTDTPYDDIQRHDASAEQAADRMHLLAELDLIGVCTVKYFEPESATVDDIRAWLVQEEQAIGRKIDVLAVDYAALLTDPTKKVRHEEKGVIALKLRHVAKEKNLWVMTPHQAVTEAMDTHKTKKIQNHHVAESRKIVHHADLHITLNPRDDGDTIAWHIAKNRYGPGTQDVVGPLPVDFDRARVAPVHRVDWPF